MLQDANRNTLKVSLSGNYCRSCALVLHPLVHALPFLILLKWDLNFSSCKGGRFLIHVMDDEKRKGFYELCFRL